ncbi:MAG TPA: hypothetical protein VGO93_30375 [Candidatus Xenobia bacterium]|jgi:hypothetical protein
MIPMKCRICKKPIDWELDQDPLCEDCFRLGQALADILPVKEPERFCAHYARHETGWVEVVDPVRVRLANIPNCTGLNLYDVVTLKPPYKNCCPRLVVGKVLERKYRCKSILLGLTDEVSVMRKQLETADAPSEGVDTFNRGLGAIAMVAYNDTTPVLDILNETGFGFDLRPVEMGRRRQRAV